METSTAKHEPFLVSEFPDVRSKKPRDIPFARFIERVRGDDFKAHTLNYRRLAAQPDRRAEAQAVKGRTPCVVTAGTCRGGHAVRNLTSYSGLLCIDLDHTDERTDEIVRRVSTLPWVVAAFRSISGNGLKVVARVSPDDAARNYRALYAAVGSAVSTCAAHPYDEHCRILTQPCYYSWDPAAWYAPEAEVFLFVPAPKRAAMPMRRTFPLRFPPPKPPHRAQRRLPRRASSNSLSATSSTVILSSGADETTSH